MMMMISPGRLSPPPASRRCRMVRVSAVGPLAGGLHPHQPVDVVLLAAPCSHSITWADIPCRCHLCRPAPGPPAGRRCCPWARSGRRWRVLCPAAGWGGAPAARPPCWCRTPPTPARTGCPPAAPRQTHWTQITAVTVDPEHVPPPEPVPPLQQPPVAVVAHPGTERSSSDESPCLVQRAVLRAGGVVARTHHQLRAGDTRID